MKRILTITAMALAACFYEGAIASVTHQLATAERTNIVSVPLDGQMFHLKIIPTSGEGSTCVLRALAPDALMDASEVDIRNWASETLTEGIRYNNPLIIGDVLSEYGRKLAKRELPPSLVEAIDPSGNGLHTAPQLTAQRYVDNFLRRKNDSFHRIARFDLLVSHYGVEEAQRAYYTNDMAENNEQEQEKRDRELNSMYFQALDTALFKQADNTYNSLIDLPSDTMPTGITTALARLRERRLVVLGPGIGGIAIRYDLGAMIPELQRCEPLFVFLDSEHASKTQIVDVSAAADPKEPVPTSSGEYQAPATQAAPQTDATGMAPAPNAGDVTAESVIARLHSLPTGTSDEALMMLSTCDGDYNSTRSAGDRIRSLSPEKLHEFNGLLRNLEQDAAPAAPQTTDAAGMAPPPPSGEGAVDAKSVIARLHSLPTGTSDEALMMLSTCDGDYNSTRSPEDRIRSLLPEKLNEFNELLNML